MNAHTPVLKPLGMPKGMDPREWRQSVEKRLNDLLDRAMSLITALDLMEADYCDDEATGDDESSLGWGERPGCHMECDDREQDDCDDEDGHDAEGYCPEDYGETIMWPDDLKSQEVLVRYE
ncbi:hypothetical protein [Mesorhizobium kowhaii]|uniref:Uncharacterized protein n=1 Tax=Mesorhizobium kowhaii TaxID=1300272 RepID=A0A2W7BZY3_9HYPH|nr:hypothetical protein [Mesorhizobium kowhaii]PZV36154.1 hypothetical protein B5V02_23395 [Mesorhizobium kowhaii]